MAYEGWIARRYLRSRRREKFISWITGIATAGLALGVLTLNVVLAVYSGFEADLRDKILGFHPHLVVLRLGQPVADPAALVQRTAGFPAVEAASPFLYGQAMLAHGKKVTGVLVRGVPPGSERVVPLRRFLQAGEVGDLAGTEAPGGLPRLLVGSGVAEKLGLAVGEPVNVIAPSATASSVGFVPRVERFVVSGIFRSGLAEYDGALVYMDLLAAQQFFQMPGTATGIELRLHEVGATSRTADELRTHLGPGYRVRTWMDLNQNLFSALAIGKAVYFLVLLLIVLVAAFNVVSTLVLVVMEKRKDIAILKSMGAPRRAVRRIFVTKGMVIGGLGTITGSLGAWAVCALLSRYRFIELPADVYGIDTLQVRTDPATFLLVALASLAICWLATLYPARQASRLPPVEVIRYE